jgi:hypothetical protein
MTSRANMVLSRSRRRRSGIGMKDGGPFGGRYGRLLQLAQASTLQTKSRVMR